MNAKDRFLTKVAKRHDCWMWQGYTDNKMGYGMFWFDGTMHLSHRIAFLLFRGTIPDGLHVCHSCDVPACVNPDHLWLGTNADNVADKVAKGRAAGLKGEKHPRAKLNEGIVRQIRASKESGRSLARRLEIDRSTIQYIRQRKLWSHVE